VLYLQVRRVNDPNSKRRALAVLCFWRAAPVAQNYTTPELKNNKNQGLELETLRKLLSITPLPPCAPISLPFPRMEYEDDDEIIVLPCQHAEHAACLEQWLKTKRCCPVCLAEIPGLGSEEEASRSVDF